MIMVIQNRVSNKRVVVFWDFFFDDFQENLFVAVGAQQPQAPYGADGKKIIGIILLNVRRAVSEIGFGRFSHSLTIAKTKLNKVNLVLRRYP